VLQEMREKMRVWVGEAKTKDTAFLYFPLLSLRSNSRIGATCYHFCPGLTPEAPSTYYVSLSRRFFFISVFAFPHVDRQLCSKRIARTSGLGSRAGPYICRSWQLVITVTFISIGQKKVCTHRDGSEYSDSDTLSTNE
jgi:hypothetical protein